MILIIIIIIKKKSTANISHISTTMSYILSPNALIMQNEKSIKLWTNAHQLCMQLSIIIVHVPNTYISDHPCSGGNIYLHQQKP